MLYLSTRLSLHHLRSPLHPNIPPCLGAIHSKRVCYPKSAKSINHRKNTRKCDKKASFRDVLRSSLLVQKLYSSLCASRKFSTLRTIVEIRGSAIKKESFRDVLLPSLLELNLWLRYKDYKERRSSYDDF